MKETINYKAKTGTLKASRPSYSRRGEQIENDPYKKWARQDKKIVEACMTCPYKDCRYQNEKKCKHFMRYVYGKDSGQV